MQPVTVTVGPLATADADNVCLSQAAAAAQDLVINGAAAAGTFDADSIAASQTPSGAGALTLNGALVTSGVAYLPGPPTPSRVYITSAGDDSGETFTVTGTVYSLTGPASVSETVTGANTDVVATATLFSTVTSVTISGAAAAAVTVGHSGLATQDVARRILFTSAGDDSGVVFSLYGTDWAGNAISEDVTGSNASTASSVLDYLTVTRVVTDGATGGALTIGTSGVAGSAWVSFDDYAGGEIAIQATVSGTVSGKVQQTLDDPNRPSNQTAPLVPSVARDAVTWVSHPATDLATITATAQGNYAYPPRYARVQLELGHGNYYGDIPTDGWWHCMSLSPNTGLSVGSGLSFLSGLGDSGLSGASATTVISGAATLAAGETDAFALDFTDATWQASTGFFGSAYTVDTGTPANDFDSSPVTTASSLLTYTSPSLKMTMGPGGTLRYQAHNLYLNSAAPANQSITVVSGATYSITITGSVSTTASGAATGTWTAGTNTFTAATTTLTLGSTSGSGTVHLRRTPSDSTYLATTSAARYDLPYDWDTDGNLLGVLVEEARTNLLLQSNAFTTTWSTNLLATPSKNANGPLGTTTAWTITDSNAGGTGECYILQNVTNAGAATQAISVYAKASGADYLAFRVAGGGYSTIQTAHFNLSTGSVATVSNCTASIELVGDGFYRCAAFVTTAAGTGNIRIYACDADATLTSNLDGTTSIIISQADATLGSFPTSPIETLASTVTRLADNLSWTDTGTLIAAGDGTIYANSYILDYSGGADTIVNLNNATSGEQSRQSVYVNSSTEVTTVGRDATATTTHAMNVGALTAVPATRNVAIAFADNDFQLCANGTLSAADTTGLSGTNANKIWIGRDYASTSGSLYIKQIMYLPRRMTDAELQTITTPDSSTTGQPMGMLLTLTYAS